ncbi:hypothetical protein [Spirillospora sp. NPDC048819]|uniref:hypothetical protein n=1 Tax=Spirillospora sp. NPDC048819 TaxID=3155268 RepID=UPI0033F0294A
MKEHEIDEDLLTVLGALRLARMIPLLSVIETPLLEAVDEIVHVYGEMRGGVRLEAIDAITDWRSKAGNMEESASTTYFQSTAGGVALAVAGETFIERRASVIQYSPGNFWEACDNIVHRVSGYQMVEFGELKTTLAGVEYMWQNQDLKCMEKMQNLRAGFELQLQKIQAKSDQRFAVARAIARCAGWQIRL